MYIKFWSGSIKQKYHLEDQDIDQRIILKMDLTEIGWEHVDWIRLGQDRDKWWALVNMVI
jgi:hypothetical protein